MSARTNSVEKETTKMRKILLVIVLALVISIVFPIFAIPISVLLIVAGILIYRKSDTPDTRNMGIATISIGAALFVGFTAFLMFGYGIQGKAVFEGGILTETVILPEVTPTP